MKTCWFFIRTLKPESRMPQYTPCIMEALMPCSLYGARSIAIWSNSVAPESVRLRLVAEVCGRDVSNTTMIGSAKYKRAAIVCAGHGCATDRLPRIIMTSRMPGPHRPASLCKLRLMSTYCYVDSQGYAERVTCILKEIRIFTSRPAAVRHATRCHDVSAAARSSVEPIDFQDLGGSTRHDYCTLALHATGLARYECLTVGLPVTCQQRACA